MMKYDRAGSSRWRVWMTLACVLFGSLALTQLPTAEVNTAKATVQQALQPGQLAVRHTLDRCSQFRSMITAVATQGFDVAGQERELKRLQDENTRLLAKLNWLAARAEHAGGSAADETDDHLLRFDTISARVLGSQARRQLARHGLVDVGRSDGVQDESLLLVDETLLIDRGRLAGVDEEDWLLAGRAVWGRVVHVDEQTSIARRVTDSDYRDVVEIVHRADDQIVRGPRGVLEGRGETLCRIRLVPITAGVAVGDWVYSSTREVGLWAPLLYGRIERIEQPAGAVHWEIWMRPAADVDHVDRVAVLHSEPHPARMAATPATRR